MSSDRDNLTNLILLSIYDFNQQIYCGCENKMEPISEQCEPEANAKAIQQAYFFDNLFF